MFDYLIREINFIRMYIVFWILKLKLILFNNDNQYLGYFNVEFLQIIYNHILINEIYKITSNKDRAWPYKIFKIIINTNYKFEISI